MNVERNTDEHAAYYPFAADLPDGRRAWIFPRPFNTQIRVGDPDAGWVADDW